MSVEIEPREHKLYSKHCDITERNCDLKIAIYIYVKPIMSLQAMLQRKSEFMFIHVSHSIQYSISDIIGIL